MSLRTALERTTVAGTLLLLGVLGASGCSQSASSETRSDAVVSAASVAPVVPVAPVASSSPPPAATGGPATAPAACGKKGLPDCPLQGWMKANVQVFLKSGDKERLAGALDELGRHEPVGYAGWSASSKAAADAARAGDFVRVRAECKTCHDSLRSRFRTEMRSTRLF